MNDIFVSATTQRGCSYQKEKFMLLSCGWGQAYRRKALPPSSKSMLIAKDGTCLPDGTVL